MKEEDDSEPGLIHTDAHIATIKDISCKVCHTTFSSNNKLHNHLKLSSCLSKQAATPANPIPQPNNDTRPGSNPSRNGKVVKSTADGTKGDGFGFRGWHYATIEARLQKLSGLSYDVCLDTGCTMSIIDRVFLTEAAPRLST